MRAIWNITWSSVTTFDPAMLIVTRHARARRMRLSIDPRRGSVRLTLPPRQPLAEAQAWVAEKRGWIEAQLATLAQPVPFADGTVLEVAGEALTIRHDPAASARPKFTGSILTVGGDPVLLPTRARRWLMARALELLERETQVLAARHGLSVGRVSVGDPHGRWGSCNANGDIRYSWRLILAPPDVLRATVAHEVAHLVHMHHGPAFHAEVARLFGRSPAAERAWLKRHGAGLHWIGRAG